MTWEILLQKASEALSLQEVQYPLLIFFLFVLPKLLERVSIPSGITAFVLGAALGLGPGWFEGDQTVAFLGTLGIISLFLFAGMEVELKEIKEQRYSLLAYIGTLLVLLVALAMILRAFLFLPFRASLLLALALVTPSAGFILDSLNPKLLNEHQRSWIRSKVIGFELVALAVMFFSLQSADWTTLAISLGLMLAMILFLPALFRLFARRIAPFAPRSEFAFLLMVAILSGLLTSKLGAYYLIGAFVVGMVAQRFEMMLPNMRSQQMIESIKFFSGFFIPFYFFKAGTHQSMDDITITAFIFAGIFLLSVTPIRIFSVLLHRKVFHHEELTTSLPIAVSLLPTLVFGLVLAGILSDRFHIPAYLHGGLVIYTILITILPTFIRRMMNRPVLEEPGKKIEGETAAEKSN